MKVKSDQVKLISIFYAMSMDMRILICSILLPIFAFMNLSYGYSAEWSAPPNPQPNQIWSDVDYDPKLTDPFFTSNAYTYEDHITKRLDGSFYDTDSNKVLVEEPTRVKLTAACFSNSYASTFKHPIIFCDARLSDENMVELLIYRNPPGFYDRLKVWVQDGMFACQYWTLYKAGPRMDLTWTTKRQKLTLDKKEYGKGDVIKGRIDFECVQEIDEPKYIKELGRSPRIIQVFGVFKTIVE